MADSLTRKGAAVEFIGSQYGIESALVPRAGYALHSLPLKALAGNPLDLARATTLFLKAVHTCTRIIHKLRPEAILGVGGYASAPAVAAARATGVPTFLHEQNSVPGRVNRVAARFTSEALVTFPAARERLTRAVLVGMPTREELFGASRQAALEALGLEPPVVLVFGGSGGALKINLAAEEAFGSPTPYTVVQISGRRDFARLSTRNPRHRILEYVDDIWRYLAAAEVVVSRAGAGSLFDIAAVGRASVLIPFPHATGDHQLHNARYFTDSGAAQMVPDAEVSAKTIRGRVEGLLGDDTRRGEFERRARDLATPRAADEVAGRLLAAGERTDG